jgi:hypothetical protein
MVLEQPLQATAFASSLAASAINSNDLHAAHLKACCQSEPSSNSINKLWLLAKLKPVLAKQKTHSQWHGPSQQL